MNIPRSLRTTILWTHLLTGVFAGLVVFVMSVTGVLLAYERQMIEWADGFSVAPPTADAKPVPVETIIANVRTAIPDATVSNVSLNADPYKPVSVRSGRTTIFVDPYSGSVLGEGNPTMRSFVSWARGWHRWLAMAGDNRTYGKAITGASNLGFLFLVVSGFYLWWPRRWTWKTVKPVVLPSSKLRGKPRDFNWHNSLGFWAAIPLFFVVLTGVFISYRWPRELTDKLLGAGVEAREGEPGRRGAGDGEGNQRPRGAREGAQGEQAGAFRGESPRDAAPREGARRDRAMREGAGREGSVREGAMREGSTPDGAMRTRASRGSEPGEPRTGESRTGEPRTGEPRTGEPRTGEPRTGGPRGERAAQQRGGGPPGGGRGERKPPMELPTGQLDYLVADAQRRAVGWKTLSFSLPTEGDKSVSFTVNRSKNPRPDTREQLKLGVTDGQFVGLTTYRDGPLSRRLTSWVRFLHTGEVFGVVGQTIAMLASLIGAVLVWTGLALTLRRFRAWRKRRGRPERLMQSEEFISSPSRDPKPAGRKKKTAVAVG